MIPFYRHGVLINNYSEDLFGVDLYKKRSSGAMLEDPQVTAARKCSVSHLAHQWYSPKPYSTVPDPETAAAQDRRLCVPQHLLFGHAGDVDKDPRRNLQRREFYSSHQFFYQNPVASGEIKQAHRVPSELYLGDPQDLQGVAPVSTKLVQRSRSRWSDEAAADPVIVEWWMSSEHSSEKGVTQADLKQVDIDAEFKSSSSSDGSESEGEDDGRPESTPEMLMRAVAVGGELAKQMTDKWVSDNQTGLKYCYSGSEKKLFMWNPRSQSMYHWKGRGSMDFMWQANQSSQEQYQQQGRAQPQAAVGEAPKSSDDAEQADHEEKVLWMTYIPSSYLWGKDPQKNMDSPEDSAEENDAAGDDEESEPSSATEPKHKKARMAADNASMLAKCDARVPGFKDFAKRWAIDVNIMRHFAKHDGMLIRHVIDSFKPTKAKAKNALQKYLQGLTKFPQKWRIVAACKQAVLLEEAEGETRELVPPRSVVVGSAEEDLRGPSDESVTRLVLPPDAGYVSPEHFRIFPLGDDFYVQDLGSDYGITVDGLRYRSTDGPIGPLKDGSIVSIGGGSQHAPPMFLCEFNAPKELRKRRVEPATPSSPEEATTDADAASNATNGEKNAPEESVQQETVET
ncbi:hypothetical protein FOZ61_006083 [Perkinsus olseni]|uniref:FHA domain-containing protein n=1 Tax=Perkinsus olseni TaxID=32597 RepID=A0A7J6MB46_PEROL|nr:hypothetical protein FOZ61_006083 [Perkinsus olseni]